MPLKDVLERLYARRRFGIRPGVDRVGEHLRRLGNPEKTFRTIHVAGTNGKGSTSAFLAAILLKSGHSVAQFSSPHLVRFTERFRINGAEYSPEKLAHMLDAVLETAPEEATFFEITTALAAYVFSEEKVELAVMEAGMGGRSDATAAFDGELTVLTPIDLDHTDYLGATLADIAREKAGIIKPGSRVVSSTQHEPAREVIELECRAKNGLLHSYGKDFALNANADGTFDYSGSCMALTQLSPGLAGRYQSRNAALALAAAEALDAVGVKIAATAMRQGIAAAYWPGRMELVPGDPPLLLDGAHNPAGAAALAEALGEYVFARLLLVTGVCEDKDIEQIYAPLATLATHIYTVTPAIERAMQDVELADFFRKRGIASQPCGSVVAGIAAARSHAVKGDLILVCGSLFVVGEAKAWLEQMDFTGIRG
jgi:dihydrofolate synthase/folylpolyglutamate synthase